MSAADTPTYGLDVLPLDDLSDWTRPRVHGLSRFVSSRLVAAGRSNLTYVLADESGRHVVLRRPPARIEFEGAHDMSREYRIQSALHGATPVPVPEPLAQSDGDGPLGAPFYLMDFIDGAIIRDEASAGELSESARAHAGISIIDKLATLHRVNPDDVGLGSLGKPSGYLERHLRRWASQIADDAPFAGELRRIHASLSERIPEQQSTSLVHGDYRLDNCVLSDGGQVQAILDWELSTQGDPLVDLGWLLLYWQPEGALASILPKGSEAAGFVSRGELMERYSSASGLDLGDVDCYMAFAAWRLAVITLGVQSRYAAGEGAGDDIDANELTRHVEVLAATAAEHLNTW